MDKFKEHMNQIDGLRGIRDRFYVPILDRSKLRNTSSQSPETQPKIRSPRQSRLSEQPQPPQAPPPPQSARLSRPPKQQLQQPRSARSLDRPGLRDINSALMQSLDSIRNFVTQSDSESSESSEWD